MSAQERLDQAFADSWMKPQAYRGADIQLEIMEAGLDLEDDGIYCRLSASGYMDCTDWSGPFESLDEAADHLIEMYADDWDDDGQPDEAQEWHDYDPDC